MPLAGTRSEGLEIKRRQIFQTLLTRTQKQNCETKKGIATRHASSAHPMFLLQRTICYDWYRKCRYIISWDAAPVT
jgi:hypothetical protein